MTDWTNDGVLSSPVSLVQKCFHIQEDHEALHHIISPLNLKDPTMIQVKLLRFNCQMRELAKTKQDNF